MEDHEYAPLRAAKVASRTNVLVVFGEYCPLSLVPNPERLYVVRIWYLARNPLLGHLRR